MPVRRAAAVVVTVVALVGGVSCSRAKNAASRRRTSTSTSAARSSGAPCSPAKPHAAAQSSVHITIDGVDREYLLYVPRSYTGTNAVPVVFNFHGFGSTANQQMLYGDFRPLADRDTFLIVAPNGSGEGVGRHFNVAALPGEPNDLKFTLAILDSLEKDFCVDSHRVYSTGMSDGGAMTSLLACAASDRFAAFGPVAVVFYAPQCDRARSVPIAAFMGDADPIVPFNGGRVNCCGGATIPSAPTSMQGWATHDGCASPPQEQAVSSEVTLRQWTGCKPAGDVRFYIIKGGGHTWPGAAIAPNFLGKTTRQISASETLWAFFQAHPLP